MVQEDNVRLKEKTETVSRVEVWAYPVWWDVLYLVFNSDETMFCVKKGISFDCGIGF